MYTKEQREEEVCVCGEQRMDHDRHEGECVVEPCVCKAFVARVAISDIHGTRVAELEQIRVDMLERARKAERERDEALRTSEGRREQLSRLACEKTLEWKRAEKAEAEVTRLARTVDRKDEQMAELQERGERLGIALANVSGALVDSGIIVPEDATRYGEAVRQIVRERDEALADCTAAEKATHEQAKTLRQNAKRNAELEAALSRMESECRNELVRAELEGCDADGPRMTHWKELRQMCAASLIMNATAALSPTPAQPATAAKEGPCADGCMLLKQPDPVYGNASAFDDDAAPPSPEATTHVQCVSCCKNPCVCPVRFGVVVDTERHVFAMEPPPSPVLPSPAARDDDDADCLVCHGTGNVFFDGRDLECPCVRHKRSTVISSNRDRIEAPECRHEGCTYQGWSGHMDQDGNFECGPCWTKRLDAAREGKR